MNHCALSGCEILQILKVEVHEAAEHASCITAMLLQLLGAKQPKGH